jgi:hypothetical protein
LRDRSILELSKAALPIDPKTPRIYLVLRCKSEGVMITSNHSDNVLPI